MKAWQCSGAHRYYIAQDVLYWESHGIFNLENGKLITELQDKIHTEYGYNLNLIDASDGGTITPEARKWMAHNAAEHRSDRSAAAIFGAGLLVRAGVNLLLAARYYFSQNDSPFIFVKTEAEAWTYVDEQRRRYRQQLGLLPLAVQPD